MANVFGRIKNAWDAFKDDSSNFRSSEEYVGYTSTIRPDRMRYSMGRDRSTIVSFFNKVAVDCSLVSIRHVRLDEEDRLKNYMDTPLDKCLTLSANLDQTGRSFKQDMVASMLDEGCIAVFPAIADENPDNGSYDVYELRTGKILQWYPNYVQIRAYDERDGKHKDITVPKSHTCIIENPFYSSMNESNSAFQRLNRKLILLDAIDEQSGSGKLNLIVQLPYVVRGENRKKQAKQRAKEIEMQLTSSKYGIAYTDGTEHITQLNRSLENNIMDQVEYLTKEMYNQLGIDESILNGTADEKTQMNYQKRLLEPILTEITDEMTRKFLTDTARTQGQAIKFFQDPFRLIPVDKIADLADKMTRNEIMTSNEFRQLIGMKPSDDPAANELRNKNLNQSAEAMAEEQEGFQTNDPEAMKQQFDKDMQTLDDFDRQLDELSKGL